MAAPYFTVLTVVEDPDLDLLERTARSLVDQRFTDWEWIVAVPDQQAPSAVRIRDIAPGDARIHLVAASGHGALAAIHAVGTGEFVTFLGETDLLVKNALHHVAQDLRDDDTIDMLYSDEDVVSDSDERSDRYLKADWSPERLRHVPYVGDLLVVRRSTVELAGGIAADDSEARRYDLVLRVGEIARHVHHARRLLYGRRVPEPAVTHAWCDALTRHLQRADIAATAALGPLPGTLRVIRAPDLTTSVSVVIPTIGTSATVWGEPRVMVVSLVRSLIDHDSHPDIEFVIVYDDPTPQHVLDELRSLEHEHGARITLVRYSKPFNFSEKCNVGAYHASGDVVVFLNDDMQTRGEDVIGQLLAPLREPDVGATGPKLFFENGLVQHGGVGYGSGHIVDRHRSADPLDPGDHGEMFVNREQSALTGACIALRRDLFEQIGGFTERLPMNFNDVDFSLKIRRTGRRLLWLYDVHLWHFESISRETTVHAWEVDLMVERWDDFRVIPERFTTGIR